MTDVRTETGVDDLHGRALLAALRPRALAAVDEFPRRAGESVMAVDPNRDEWADEEGLDIEPDVPFVEAVDDAPDASAALREGGGDADRAERLLEASIESLADERLPDDERLA